MNEMSGGNDYNASARADEKAPSPATCVRVSILDFGHPLRGGSSMRQGGTAKAVLCFTIIHLGVERERKGKKEEEKKRTHLYCKEKKTFFIAI